MNNLATGYQAAGKLDLALPLLEKTLKLRKVKLGPDHPDTLTSMNNLAAGYHAVGKLDLALQLYEETLKLRKAKLGPDHPHTLLSMGNLAKARLDAKQPDKALPLFEEFVAGMRQRLGADTSPFAGQLAQISLELLKANQFRQAEKLLRECLAIREKKEAQAWTRFNTQSMLGGALLGQKKYAEAEPLLKAGYEGMKARAKTIPPQGKVRLIEAVERLVQLYDGWGKPDEAAKWRKELPPQPKKSSPEPK
jgi:tetratricopeptide (TPR) repeat protein